VMIWKLGSSSAVSNMFPSQLAPPFCNCRLLKVYWLHLGSIGAAVGAAVTSGVALKGNMSISLSEVRVTRVQKRDKIQTYENQKAEVLDRFH
jgi:hypothetical protein